MGSTAIAATFTTTSSSSSSSSFVVTATGQDRVRGCCCNRVIECMVRGRACVLCICCPSSLVRCCVQLPYKIGWHAVRRLMGTCCGSDPKIVAAGFFIIFRY
uniref:Uncharacterized protein n=1 Tax=Nelumbo nucifera TaxID=4432 RepID=A0A822YTJ8_NELNU|nr:TPA_asm: hypothetical protein HUJ06_006073 [Nelumbo nucifera]